MRRVNVLIGSQLFPDHAKEVSVSPRLTLSEALSAANVPPLLIPYARIMKGQSEVPEDQWATEVVGTQLPVSILLTPAFGQGNEGMSRVFASLIGMFAFGSIGGNVGGFGGGVITVVGSLLSILAATTFLPPQTDEDDLQDYSITGAQNRVRPWESVPKVYGKIRITPPMAVEPVTEIVGQDQYINVLYCLGYKPLRISDLRFGDQRLRDLASDGERFIAKPPFVSYGQDVQVTMDTGWPGQSYRISMFPRDVSEERMNERIKYAADWVDPGPPEVPHSNVIRYITQPGTIRIGLDFVFPQGLGTKDQDTWRVDISIRYRPKGATGDDTWQYYIPKSNLPDVNEDVRGWVDTDAYTHLTTLNTTLEGVATELEAISVGSRNVQYALRQWMADHLARTDTLRQSLVDNEDLTAGELTQLGRLGTVIDRVETVLDTATDVVEEFNEGVHTFNDKLSTIINVISFIDSMMDVNRYISRGYGPDLETLTEFQRLMVYSRSMEALFGTPDPNTFIVVNEEHVEGQLWKNITWDVAPGQYEVQVRRATAEANVEDAYRTAWFDPLDKYQWDNRRNDTDIRDALYLFAGRSTTADPGVSDAALDAYAFVAMRIKAGEDVSGDVDSFNCLAEAPLEWWDSVSGTWKGPALEDDSGNAIYRDPSTVFADILRGSANGDPATDAQIDTTRLEAWKTYCLAQGYKFDYYFEKKDTAFKALQTVARVGKASACVRDGMLSVVYDYPNETPVQLISLRNSQGFQGQRQLVSLPHAIRVRFRDEREDYEEEEVVIFRAGYGPNGAAATKVEDFSFPGVSDANHARKLGTYLFNSLAQRPEVYSLKVDWEHYAFERGDCVGLVHDIPLFGLGAARIKSDIVLSGGDVVSFKMDDVVTMESGKVYQGAIRTADGEIYTGILTPYVGTTDTLTFADPLDTGSSTVAVGDLVAWGESDALTKCLVTSIVPAPDGTATITLVDAAPAVHDEDLDTTYVPNVTAPSRVRIVRPSKPTIYSIWTDERAMVKLPNGQLQCRIVVNCGLGKGSSWEESQANQDVDGWEIQYRLVGVWPHSENALRPVRVSNIARYRIYEETAQWQSMPLQPGGRQGQVYVAPVSFAQLYDIRVRAITRAGRAGRWRFHPNQVILGGINPPPNILSASYLNGELSWSYKDPPVDHLGFKVRHAYGDIRTWGAASPAHDGILTENRFRLPANEGGNRTWLVRAIDYNGNLSRKAAIVSVDMGPPLKDFQITTNEHHPTWDGTKTAMSVSGGDLQADVYTPWVSADVPFYRDGYPFYIGAADPFYQTTYLEAAYEFVHTVSDPDLPYRLGIEVDVTGGEDWQLEVSDNVALLWPADLSDDIWPSSILDAFWPSGMEFRALSGRIEAASGDIYTFRLSAPRSETRLVLNEITETQDRKGISDYVDSFFVAASGTVRLPLTKTFTAIIVVSFIIEYDVSYAAAVTARVLDKDATNGPSIELLDSSGSRVAGYIDAHIQGY